MATGSDLAHQRGGEDAVLRVAGDGGLWEHHGVGHAALHGWRPSTTEGGGSGAKHEEDGDGSVSVLLNLPPNRSRSARPFIDASCRPLWTYGIAPAPIGSGRGGPLKSSEVDLDHGTITMRALRYHQLNNHATQTTFLIFLYSILFE
jgi:hypothetical protein